MVEVTAPRDKTLRAEVVRRRIAYEADQASYAVAWSQNSKRCASSLPRRSACCQSDIG